MKRSERNEITNGSRVIPIEFFITGENVRVKKKFKWPVGTTCHRDPSRCFSNEYDRRCKGRSCPMRDQ